MVTQTNINEGLAGHTKKPEVSARSFSQPKANSKEDAELWKWISVIENKPELYLGEKNDLAVIPKHLLPKLAEKFEAVKRYIDNARFIPTEKTWDSIVIEELEKKHLGDKETKEIVFLCSLGRLVKNKNPYSYNILIGGSSSAGKDHLLDSVLDLFPGKDVERYGNMSAKALKYLHNKKLEPEWNYNGKIVSVEEVNEKTLNDEVMKILLSGGKKSGSVANNRGETIEIKGNPVVFMTSATAIANPEMLNRLSMIGIDESDEQTKRTFFAENLPYDERILKFMEELEMCEVRIPFKNKLMKVFPYHKIKYRRQFQKLLDWIRAVACLHQSIRQKHRDGSIDATLEDYDIARFPFMKACSRISAIQLKTIDKKIIETLEKSPEPLGANEIGKFTAKYISRMTLYAHLNSLANTEVLETFELKDAFGNAVTKYAISEEFRDKTPISLPASADL